ncbi:MAG TPA: hypothetical protein VLA51_02495, partial [Paracoccaceae bacterium]|nr:hypothetical protein [Paracoccaceae bacterium]
MKTGQFSTLFLEKPGHFCMLFYKFGAQLNLPGLQRPGRFLRLLRQLNYQRLSKAAQMPIVGVDADVVSAGLD